MTTQIIRNQVADDAINADKIDLADDYTFSGDVQVPSTPANSASAASKSYVDGLVSANVYWKEAVKAATDGSLSGNYVYSNGVITFSTNGAMQAIDGVTPALNDRLLIKNETAAKAPYNGIYVVSTLGTSSTPAVLTRSSDMNEASEFKGASVVVLQGSENDNTQWTCSNDTNPTVGTTDIAFVQLSNQNVTGGDGIAVTGNDVAVDLATTAGLEFSSQKLKVKVTDGIEILSDGLKAKVKAAGALVVDSNGLDVGSGQIDSTKLAAGAVGTNALANGAVDSSKIANGAVGSDQIAGSAVTDSKLASSSVTGAKVAFLSLIHI